MGSDSGSWGRVVAGGVLAGPLGVSSAMQANSAQEIAQSQQEQAQRNQDLALQYAAPSANEITQLQQSADLNKQSIDRTKQLLASSDPALMELGKQTLAMLSGQTDVGSNKFFKQDLADQRTQLERSLAQKYGSGYASSSVGIQALNDFDRKASQSLETNRQGQVNTNLAYLAPISSKGFQSEIGNSQNLAGLYGNISSRQTNAATGTGSNLINLAGAGSVGDLSSAQTMNNLAGTAIGSFAAGLGKKA